MFDGLGERTKLQSQQVTHNQNGTTSTETKTQFFVTSSVLNQVVTELDENGAKTRTFVYQGKEVLAWQQQSGSTQTIAWEHRDMSNASVTISGLAEGSKGAELEPLGMDAGAFHLIAPAPPAYRPPLKDARDYPGFGGIGISWGLSFSASAVGTFKHPKLIPPRFLFSHSRLSNLKVTHFSHCFEKELHCFNSKTN